MLRVHPEICGAQNQLVACNKQTNIVCDHSRERLVSCIVCLLDGGHAEWRGRETEGGGSYFNYTVCGERVQ